MKLIIGNKNYSSWSLRAWLAARESGIAFGEIDIPLFIPGSRERILSHSPSGKVPCLNDHGVVVWDSLAIGEYLAETQPALLPTSPPITPTSRLRSRSSTKPLRRASIPSAGPPSSRSSTRSVPSWIRKSG